MIIGLIMWRTYKIVKSSSVLHSVLSLCGALSSAGVVWTWVDDQTYSSCVAQVPLFTISLSLLLVPIVIKTIRLYKIFHSADTTLRVVRVNQMFMVVLMSVIFVPLIICNLYWLTVSQPTTTWVKPDPKRESLSYNVCSSQSSSPLVVLGLELLILLVVQCVCSWGIRRSIRHSEYKHLFDDSNSIFYSSFSFMFLFAIIIAVSFNLPNDTNQSRNVAFVIRSIGYQVACMVTILLLYASKLLRIMSGEAVYEVTNEETHLSSIKSNMNDKKNSIQGTSGIEYRDKKNSVQGATSSKYEKTKFINRGKHCW
jgi:hypothetical protein